MLISWQNIKNPVSCPGGHFLKMQQDTNNVMGYFEVFKYTYTHCVWL